MAVKEVLLLLNLSHKLEATLNVLYIYSQQKPIDFMFSIR